MEFTEIKKQALREWQKLEQSNIPVFLIGTATCGRSAGALDVWASLEKVLDQNKIKARVIEVGCIGLCFAEPLVTVIKPGRPGICYGQVTGEKITEIIQKYLIDNDPLAEYALGTVGRAGLDNIPRLFEIPVFQLQVRRVLRNCGFIDPNNINHYIARGGYGGFIKALKLKPQDVIEQIKESGLRGRGGAGFPTWRKWQFCRKAKSSKKYLICNADEGDPGAFMDRSVLEGDPHSVLEGMLIAAYAIGAQESYIYCRAEYPLALERLRSAIKQMEDNGLSGKNIQGSKFNFHIKIKEGAGAFVCGEETALIASIEGKRGMPKPRPPFPAIAGLNSRPTIINNVETLANIAVILQNSPAWFAEYGTEQNKGTKTFALAGKINRTGLIEVPLGITLKEIVFNIGGGILNNKKFKAIQTGGPSGGCLPAKLLNTPVDYDSLTRAGSIMGSGGMVVMDEDNCMVDIARFFLDFTQKESCGECVPCRLGTKQMLDILEDITRGRGREGDIELLEELALGIKSGALCGLGQTAPNPVLTTIRYFRDEYEAHIKTKKCPAKTCKHLIKYSINKDKCTGCTACARVCSVDAISGQKKEVHEIDQEVCIKCGRCYETCKFEAIDRA